MLSEEQQINDTSEFKKFIKQHFKSLLIFSLIGGVLGFIGSFFIPREFESFGNVYPPLSPSIEFSIENPNFGYDIEADRLIQIFQSNEIRDSVIKKFDLVDYYDIQKTEPDWTDKLFKKYKKSVFFERTPGMSILIGARTEKPQLSSDIVNYIIGITDQTREKIYKQNIRLAYQSALSDFESQKAKTDSAQKLLVFSLQANKMNNLLILASNSQISMDIDKLNNFKSDDNFTIGSQIIAFKNLHDRLNESEIRLVKVKKALTNPIPKIYVIDKAEPRFKKVSPSKLLTMAIAMLFSFVITLIVLLTGKIFGSRQ
jgi:capsular polysaccharide biosynthesis protein